MSILPFTLKKLHGYRLLILPLLIASAAHSSYAASYVINPKNTSVRFAIEHFKTSTTTGSFYNVKGQLQYDSIAKSGDISLMIPIDSLNTGNKAINNNLKGTGFFNMRRFPSAHFQSTNWYFNNSQVTRVDGNLTLHGETHPISLIATKFNCYQASIAKNEVCSGEFSTTIDRTKWNINKFSLFGLTKNLDLKVQIEATKQ